MSTITVSNIKATGETASRAVSGVAAAWANIDGVTPSARDSLNVASLTDEGTAVYTINVSNSFSSVDHSPVVSGPTNNGRTTVLATTSRTFATSSISISTSGWTVGMADYAASSYNADPAYIISTSHGDLA